MKSENVKRFLAILSACAIVVTGIPVTANAAEMSDAVVESELSDAAVNTDETEVKSEDNLTENNEDNTEVGVEVQTVTPLQAATAMATAVAENAASNTSEIPSTDVQAQSEEPEQEEATPTADTETAKIVADVQSGKNAYHTVSSEFTVQNVDDNTVLVTKWEPGLQQSYDIVVVPGAINGKAVQYGADFLTCISTLKKGIIFESGATMVTSTNGLNITYVRFESGAKAVSASSTFKGWSSLTSVVGFGEALSEYGIKEALFTETFSGCTVLKDVTLNLYGMSTEFNNTFAGINGINSIRINGCSISKIYMINPIDSKHVYPSLNQCDAEQRTVTFSDILFPSNGGEAYLRSAFTNMPGSVIFNNCKAGEELTLNFDGAYYGSVMMPYDTSADSAGNIATSLEPGGGYNDSCTAVNVSITGAAAYSTNSMFENCQLKNVDLTNLITTDTRDVSSMFKGATLAEIKGVSTWRFGHTALVADEMFANTRVYFGPGAYLTRTLIPAIKKLDWSCVVRADKLFGFIYKGECPIDYSGMDLSSVENMTVSGLSNYDFITPEKAPQNYVFEQGNVYELRAGSTLGGKALDTIEVTDGKVAGSDIKSNTHVYTDYATISITDVSSDKEVSTAVVPGYKLSEYLDSKIAYYQDRSLTQTVSPELVVNTGDKVTLYCMLSTDGVSREIIDDAEVDFGDNLENVEITLEDDSKDKLQGGNADLTIKIETANKNTSAVIPSSVQKFAKSSFFNIDLIATVGGVDKKVSEMSQKATIYLPLPNDYESGSVKVLNYHDGFDKNPIIIDATVDKTAGLVTFETDKFSPYVMLYGEDDTVEMDTIDVTIKWTEDTKDKSGRVDIDLDCTVTYEDNSTLSFSSKYVADTTKDETKVTFTYPKTNGGSPFKSYSFTKASDISVDGYIVKFANSTLTYTLTYNRYDNAKKETINVTVDFSGMTDEHFRQQMNIINTSGGGYQLVEVMCVYDDNSENSAWGEISLENGKRVYTVPVEVYTKKYTGANLKKYSNIKVNNLSNGDYETITDIENLKVTFVAVGEESAEKTRHNFAVKVVDDNNSGKTRPDKIIVQFTAKYGAFTKTKYVEVNLSGMTGNTTNAYVELPNTVGGVSLSSLEAATATGTNIGYRSEWNTANMLFKYILEGASDTDPDPTVVIDPIDVMVTFVGGTADSRPNKVTVTIADSNNQNTVTKEIATPFAPSINSYKESFNRLVNDTYHVAGVSGVNAALYKVEYSGLNVTVTYTGNQTVVTTPTTKKTVTINMDDNNNEDGLRPKSIKVTVANKDGSDSITSDITVGDANTFTYQVDVKNPNDEYTVKSVSGMPESYTVTMSGMTITCKHTVEKITKTFKVEWSGDGDNADKTRPNSVQLTIKNGGSSVTTATVSEDTNWTANVSLNKLIKGVEASYSVEGADVTNYSKSVSGDTVTYKFTGTLSKDAATIEANKNGGINAASVDGAELSFDIANFDWIDYANKYPDLKKAYGYNKEALYAHYIRYGIGEGRVATFTGKYATVNEDILKAYFPEDYKYKTDLSTTNEEYLIGADKTTSATSSANKVTVDSNGNVHTTVKNPDGTTTETITDADGNIISVSTYKTGDMRMEDMSTYFIILGVLLLAVAAFIVRIVIKDDKRKKAVLSMIS